MIDVKKLSIEEKLELLKQIVEHTDVIIISGYGSQDAIWHEEINIIKNDRNIWCLRGSDNRKVISILSDIYQG